MLIFALVIILNIYQHSLLKIALSRMNNSCLVVFLFPNASLNTTTLTSDTSQFFALQKHPTHGVTASTVSLYQVFSHFSELSEWNFKKLFSQLKAI